MENSPLCRDTDGQGCPPQGAALPRLVSTDGQGCPSLHARMGSWVGKDGQGCPSLDARMGSPGGGQKPTRPKLSNYDILNLVEYYGFVCFFVTYFHSFRAFLVVTAGGNCTPHTSGIMLFHVFRRSASESGCPFC